MRLPEVTGVGVITQPVQPLAVQILRALRGQLVKLRGRKVEVDFMDPPAVDSITDLFIGSRTRVELTNLISRLMEGEEPDALRREHGSELLEEVISALENRI
jgi:hypothetical protein